MFESWLVVGKVDRGIARAEFLHTCTLQPQVWEDCPPVTSTRLGEKYVSSSVWANELLLFLPRNKLFGVCSFILVVEMCERLCYYTLQGGWESYLRLGRRLQGEYYLPEVNWKRCDLQRTGALNIFKSLFWNCKVFQVHNCLSLNVH